MIDRAEEMEVDKALRLQLKTLTAREQQVLHHRFILGSTLKETGQIVLYGPLTVERIRQIEAQGLRKLRHPSRRVEFHAAYHGHYERLLYAVYGQPTSRCPAGNCRTHPSLHWHTCWMCGWPMDQSKAD